MSKTCEIEWSPCPRNEPPHMVDNVIRMEPGLTRMAVTHVQDIKSFFELFIPDTIQKIIRNCTWREAFGEKWKENDQTHFRGHCSFRQYIKNLNNNNSLDKLVTGYTKEDPYAGHL